jgi:GTP-binding protein Era
MGVLTRGDTQLVFTDTPGFHKPKTKLGEKMIKAVGDSISGVDACLFVVEPTGELTESELELIEKIRKSKIPCILAINKIDTVNDKTELMGRIAELSELLSFVALIPVSAVKNDGIDILIDEMEKLAFPSEHFFPEDTLTDQPERVLASEIIREKMLRLLDKEIPHGVAVSIEKMRERPDRELMDVEAIIYCEKESHKGIIIGKKGEMLKKISSMARNDCEKFMGTKVYLTTWVKVKENWRDSDFLVRNFGYRE